MFISIHQTHDKYSFGNDFIFITHLTREKQKSENISIDSRKIGTLPISIELSRNIKYNEYKIQYGY